MRKHEPVLITALTAPDSPARLEPPVRGTFRIGAVQERWHADPVEHESALRAGIEMAAREGARLVCLQELTMSPYFAVRADAQSYALTRLETIPDGPTTDFARQAAREFGVHVQASLHERAADGGLGYNTAVVVGPDGELVARVRKVHIPASDGYHEDSYFRPSDDPEPYPVVDVANARVGIPTCWDQWFPELARIYALAGADVIIKETYRLAGVHHSPMEPHVAIVRPEPDGGVTIWAPTQGPFHLAQLVGIEGPDLFQAVFQCVLCHRG